METQTKKKILTGVVAAVCAIALLLVLCVGENPLYHRLKVRSGPETFIEVMNVGQANMVLLYDRGSAALFDFGAAQPQTVYAVHRMEQLGIQKLALGVVSHPHADHIGGLKTVTKHFKLKQLLLNQAHLARFGSEEARQTVKQLEQNGTLLTEPVAGMSCTVGSALVEVLFVGDSEKKENDCAVVCSITLNGCRVLLPGDGTAALEQELIQQGRAPCNVLVLGHHGSKTSSSAEFLDAARPTVAIASCGFDNRYEFPESEVLQRLEQRKITLYRTDVDQSLRLIPENGRLKVMRSELLSQNP